MLGASHRFDFPELHLVGIIVHAPFFRLGLKARQFDVACRKTFASEVTWFLAERSAQTRNAGFQSNYLHYIISSRSNGSNGYGSNGYGCAPVPFPTF